MTDKTTPADNTQDVKTATAQTTTPPVEKPVVTPAETTKVDNKPTYEDLQKEIEKLRKESASKRVENKEIKQEKSELEKQVEATATLAKDLQTRLETAETDRAKAEKTALLAKTMVKYGIPDTLSAMFENVPADKLDATAQTLADQIGKNKPGYKSSVGSTAAGADKSMGQRIFDRISGKGPNAFDPDFHKAVGGGVVEE